MSASAVRDPFATGRQRLVWGLLVDALSSLLLSPSAPVRVLDCGGGSGSVAVPIAGTGAQVTVVDISVDALATLERRAADAGVAHLLHAVPGDLDALDDLVPASSADLAVAHDILEVVDRPGAVLASIVRAVRSGGLVSVLVSNPAAAVLTRALSGDLAGAAAELAELDRAGRLSGLADAVTLCAGAGLEVEQVRGIGVFGELVPGVVLDGRPGAADALAQLERAAGAHAPFRDIAGRFHLLCRRSPASARSD